MSVIAKSPDGTSWRWHIEYDRDDDGFDYNEHFAISSSGERKHLGWSRFQGYTEQHFIAYVTGGFPPHQDGPPRRSCLPSDIEEMPTYAAIAGKAAA